MMLCIPIIQKGSNSILDLAISKIKKIITIISK